MGGPDGWRDDSARARARGVAVVVPAWNAAEHLAAALDSVLAQTRTDWVCLVVDDGSTDGTGEVARAYLADPRFVLIAQENAGVAAARNAGLAHPAGRDADLVSFLDADDVLLPDALERLAAVLDRSPHAVGAYGTAEYVDRRGRPVNPGLHPARQRDRRRLRGLDLGPVPTTERLTTFAMLVVVGPVWPAAVVLLRADVVRRVGGFAVDLAQCEDWDLYVRASRHGDFAFVDEQVAWYRRHAGNLTNATTDNEQLAHAVRCRSWASPHNTRRQRLVAARTWRAFQHRRVLYSARRLAASARPAATTSSWSATAVLLRELVQLLRVRPPDGPTGSPLGTPATTPVDQVPATLR